MLEEILGLIEGDILCEGETLGDSLGDNEGEID
jgi:hypothetical protein